MSDLHIHIISFDIPFPANYGGVIDVFYKAKALTDSGVKGAYALFPIWKGTLPDNEGYFS